MVSTILKKPDLERLGGSTNLEYLSLPVNINGERTNLVYILGEDENIEGLEIDEESEIDYSDFPESIVLNFVNENDEQKEIFYFLGEGENEKIQKN